MNPDKQRKADRRQARQIERRAVVVERQVATVRARCESEYVAFLGDRFGGRDPKPLSNVAIGLLGLGALVREGLVK